MAIFGTGDIKNLPRTIADGLVKKTEFLAYNTPIRADGIIAIKVRDGDELALHLGVERIHLRAVEDDGADAVGDLEADDLAHAWGSPASVGSPSGS